MSGGNPARCLNDPPDPSRLDLTVRNIGDQPAVIKRLGLRVRDTGLLRIPQAGGGLEPSKDYDVLLPARPRVGELAVYKLSQEVEPRASDRFTVRLDEPEPYRQIGPRLYELDVLLYHDTSMAPVKAGTALVAVPYLPSKDLFWAGVAPDSRSGWAGSGALSTMKGNEKTFRRMLALPGERSPEMNSELVDVPVTGNEPNPCTPSGKSRTQQTAQPPLPNGAEGP